MKKTPVLLFVLLSTLTAFAQKLPIDYVNVFAGTSNSRWMLFPGPSQPFGMVKLSPDNQGNVWNGGYEYSVNSISGFSHLHGYGLSGVSYMPFVGDLKFGEEYYKLFPGPPDGPFGNMWTAGYRSRYEKESEKGSPGYYSVHLTDADATVELTATDRCGMIRTTFPKSDKSTILLDFNPPTEESSEILACTFKKVNNMLIEGSITFKNNNTNGTTVFFQSKFSKPITSTDSWEYEKYTGTQQTYGIDFRKKCNVNKNITSFISKGQTGIILHFNTNKGDQVITSTGLSFVSIENAGLNLRTELGTLNYDFDKVVSQSKETWKKLLNKIELKGKEADKAKFYTNFYRSFTGKNMMSDVNGEYLDQCGKVEKVQAPADAVYSSDSMWGTQWSLTPLWTLVSPKYANSFANSLIELQRVGGWIPQSPVSLKYALVMAGQHQNALLISAYQKGIAQFDPKKVYEMIKHDYTTPGEKQPCGGFAGNIYMKDYMDYGYVPDEVGATSHTMEYAFDDWCLSQFATALNKKADAKYFLNRSKNYENIFDKSTGYIRRKHKDGTWSKDADIFKMGTDGGWNAPGFMEGNAWIYTWFVPQDLPNLIKLMGKTEFNRRLEEGFEKGYVDLTNEPNMQAPFLFNYSGEPWLTQKYTRMVANKFFSTSPYTAWVGEEDEGQMGALYCLMSMGIFEMKSGCSVEPYYDLSSPVFDEIKINLDKKYYPGGSFTIKVENNGDGNDYIQSAIINGKKVENYQLLHKDIVKGGELKIVLGNTPNKTN
ncbi:glycoside hydrolase family 92 protein [Pedobacter changchengzhani]|uniref:Glycoside hydrolase family 92 protein n=1 Tax=Pedobacter changchengzhani TaxID=2529274 RepID=A0A4R5MNA4_9SPHI|nr:GH92 family glycosyl hydrolase [Pedobacter changchengzhani]TDG37291.1 glycoside hydrolase family 92 protein [Pedobacter changchengzhani]